MLVSRRSVQVAKILTSFEKKYINQGWGDEAPSLLKSGHHVGTAGAAAPHLTQHLQAIWHLRGF